MLDEVFVALLSLVLLLASAVLRPEAARCPRGWYVDGGVRVVEGLEPRGSFACRRFPVGGDDGPRRPGLLRSRVYCSDAATPALTRGTITCRVSPSK